MALNSSSLGSTISPSSISFRSKNPRNSLTFKHLFLNFSSPVTDSLRVSADSTPKAKFVARRKESVSVRQLGRPLKEYMSLPASQYSVLDAKRIERVDDNTFRCYVYSFKFFAFEICPVLLVRVEEQPDGCCIKLLSCKLEGSPIVVAQNEKFDDVCGDDSSGITAFTMTALPIAQDISCWKNNYFCELTWSTKFLVIATKATQQYNS
ncbi:uncharacterized protein [Populus alba]|uniref:uncharacterized protein isoform X2 n=1 Tax=Populus alba TaxID=43335 RepID=UPI00158A30D6|nr:uncharacterized protein LOC118060289 isoform X2 [Populus alba]